MKTNLFLFAALMLAVLAAHKFDDKVNYVKARPQAEVFPKV